MTITLTKEELEKYTGALSEWYDKKFRAAEKSLLENRSQYSNHYEQIKTTLEFWEKDNPKPTVGLVFFGEIK